MKLVVQIPCFNERETLADTVAEIPRQVPGIDEIEILVIDDGSSDGTAELARSLGVHHVVRHTRNLGLARAFRTGLDTALRLGADIIVNTDGDSQYAGADIPALIQPILDGRAEIVVGDRQTQQLDHFSPGKKALQRLGGFVVRRLSSTDVADVVSGFRAMSREAALRINILSSFSPTIEMLVQAGRERVAIASVPIRARAVARESRLFRSIPGFIRRSLTTMLRTYAMYHPLRVFAALGAVLVVLGWIPIARFLVHYFRDGGAGHVQSLVLGGALVVIGLVTLLVGVVADLLAFNRQLLELVLQKVRRLELDGRPDGLAAAAKGDRPDA
jgi:glycosyltransferase involved in cell wall biosynthesis